MWHDESAVGWQDTAKLLRLDARLENARFSSVANYATGVLIAH